MSNTYYLNEDTYVYGVVKYSNIETPELSEQGVKVYSVTIQNRDGLGQAIGAMFHSCCGPSCLNGEALYHEYRSARELTFESIIKPMTSGVNPDSKEFDRGTEVRLAVRFETAQGDIQEDGCHHFPKLILRFCDAGTEQDFGPKIEPVSEEILSLYDF